MLKKPFSMFTSEKSGGDDAKVKEAAGTAAAGPLFSAVMEVRDAVQNTSIGEKLKGLFSKKEQAGDEPVVEKLDEIKEALEANGSGEKKRDKKQEKIDKRQAKRQLREEHKRFKAQQKLEKKQYKELRKRKGGSTGKGEGGGIIDKAKNLVGLGAGGGGAAAAGAGGLGSILGIAGGAISAIVGLGMVGKDAYDIVKAKKEGKEAESKDIGGVAGGVSAGLAGAAIGTLILPGIGTAIGGGIGLILGNLLGNKAGEILDEQRKPVEISAEKKAAAIKSGYKAGPDSWIKPKNNKRGGTDAENSKSNQVNSEEPAVDPSKKTERGAPQKPIVPVTVNPEPKKIVTVSESREKTKKQPSLAEQQATRKMQEIQSRNSGDEKTQKQILASLQQIEKNLKREDETPQRPTNPALKGLIEYSEWLMA